MDGKLLISGSLLQSVLCPVFLPSPVPTIAKVLAHRGPSDTLCSLYYCRGLGLQYKDPSSNCCDLEK